MSVFEKNACSHTQELLSHEDQWALPNDPEAMSTVGHFLKQLQERVSALVHLHVCTFVCHVMHMHIENIRISMQVCPVKPQMVYPDGMPYVVCLHYVPDYSEGKLVRIIQEVYKSKWPSPFEVFWCTPSTTEEELQLFMKRVTTHLSHYLVLQSNCLPYSVQEVCEIQVALAFVNNCKFSVAPFGTYSQGTSRNCTKGMPSLCRILTVYSARNAMDQSLERGVYVYMYVHHS